MAALNGGQQGQSLGDIFTVSAADKGVAACDTPKMTCCSKQGISKLGCELYGEHSRGWVNSKDVSCFCM